ncbi:MAG: tetratricopeptide repeat protein [Candidatus Thorarchaeota archaeon]|jgi:tetratricopeptide (TPR) repeat protein
MVKLREIAHKIYADRKWATGWYLMNSICCGVTMIAIARWGYVPFDDLTAFLLGFFVPMVVYLIKEGMGLYKYQGRFTQYQDSEVILQRAAGDFGHGKYEDALSKFQLIIEYMPGHKRALYYAAVSAEKLGKRDLAARFYSEYLILVPNDQAARQQLENVSNQLA